MNTYYVYIITNAKEGVLYVGVTNDLIRRIYEHKEGLLNGFSQKYKLKMLVHFEMFNDIELAITREKNLKAWDRDWKIELIEKDNPEWIYLYEGLL